GPSEPADEALAPGGGHSRHGGVRPGPDYSSTSGWPPPAHAGWSLLTPPATGSPPRTRPNRRVPSAFHPFAPPPPPPTPPPRPPLSRAPAPRARGGGPRRADFRPGARGRLPAGDRPAGVVEWVSRPGAGGAEALYFVRLDGPAAPLVPVCRGG